MHLLQLSSGGNSQGRAYCLWLLARHLGITLDTFLPDGAPVWGPLRDTPFGRNLQNRADLRDEAAGRADVIICYQPVPETFAPAQLLAAKHRLPILLDIDEPHWEQRYGYTPAGRLRVVLGMLRRGRNPLPHLRLRLAAKRTSKLLSNPGLLDLYDGTLIPHVREPVELRPLPETDALKVVFVGTVRKHKGVDILRRAVARLPRVELTVTAPAPPDAHPHERWVGETTLEEGRSLLAESHVVVLPSSESNWTRRQLPVKIVDAMLAARLVVAADLPPLRWALCDTGILLPDGCEERLVKALAPLRDDRREVRRRGVQAREMALGRFTPAAVAPAFEEALERTLQNHRSGRSA